MFRGGLVNSFVCFWWHLLSARDPLSDRIAARPSTAAHEFSGALVPVSYPAGFLEDKYVI